MGVVVPFDASGRSRAAFARDRGWLDPDEPFERDSAVGPLQDRVHRIAPVADVRHTMTDRWASPGQAASEVRAVAIDVGRQPCSSTARTPGGSSRR